MCRLRLTRRSWLTCMGCMLLLLGIHTLFIVSLFDGVTISSHFLSPQPAIHLKDDSVIQINIRTSTHSSTPKTSSIQNNTTKQVILRKMLRALLKYDRPSDNEYNFNVTLSDQIPLDRDVKDLRQNDCRYIQYNRTSMPTVSIIVPFYNEALSILLRTVHSVLSRSPPNLLREVILVDDKSTHSYLGKGFEDYIHFLDNRVILLRNRKREGLIRSRLKGAARAQGEVLVFLDAHMECNIGWLEPLLAEINRFPNIVVQPHIAVIGDKNIEYFSNTDDRYRGGFGWDLRYAWFHVPKYLSQTLTSPTDPFPTPVLVGCAIAVRKSYFYHIGAFDEHLEIWGGEHLDLSFRTWMCGGRITTVPCSRVGHLFKFNSYSFGGDRDAIIHKNLRRVADIWMDEYKTFFYAATETHSLLFPLTADEQKTLKARIKLKYDLGCKNFKWYLENIMPEMPVPSVEAVFYGEIENKKTAACIRVLEDGYLGITSDCFMFRIVPENVFTIDTRGRLLYENRCVHIDGQYDLLRLGDCLPVHNSHSATWTLSPDAGPLVGKLMYTKNSSTLCAIHVTNQVPVHNKEQMVQMGNCKPESEFQIWKFQYKFSYHNH